MSKPLLNPDIKEWLRTQPSEVIFEAMCDQVTEYSEEYARLDATIAEARERCERLEALLHRVVDGGTEVYCVTTDDGDWFKNREALLTPTNQQGDS